MSTPDEENWRDGLSIPGFELGDVLSTGGMATVYQAERSSGERDLVAIKVLHPHLNADDSIVALFDNEGEIVSRIRHPNVVGIESHGVCDGYRYLVMELVDGWDLEALLRSDRARQDLTVEHAVHIALQIAEGLHAVHTAQDADAKCMRLIHGDVAPSNIMIDRTGTLKLIDFGLITTHAQRSKKVRRPLRGTVRYMSPEQVRGEPLDGRSDLFSLGAVLWEMLCGRRLFDQDTPIAVMHAVAASALPAASEYNQGVTGALDAVLASLLSAQPADRPADAEAAEHALLQACPEAGNLDRDFVRGWVKRASEEEKTG